MIRDTCGDCVHAHPSPEPAARLEAASTGVVKMICLLNPPTVFVMQGAKGEIMANGAYPPVLNNSLACSHFKNKQLPLLT